MLEGFTTKLQINVLEKVILNIPKLEPRNENKNAVKFSFHLTEWKAGYYIMKVLEKRLLLKFGTILTLDANFLNR